MAASLDVLDRALIAALRQDGRRAIADLAADLGCARATVRARLARLQEDGVILGFTVALAGEGAASPVRAVAMIAVEGKGAKKVARQLAGSPDIRAIHSTNGRFDLICEIGCEDLEAFDAVLNRIREIDGVSESETSLLLATHKKMA